MDLTRTKCQLLQTPCKPLRSWTMLHAVGANPIFRVSRQPSASPIASSEAGASEMLEQEENYKQQLCQLLHSVCQASANESEQGKFHAGMYRHGACRFAQEFPVLCSQTTAGGPARCKHLSSREHGYSSIALLPF